MTTKRALAETLKDLLAKRNLDKITVKDIVETCGVNRQTFYYHFHDIYDLVEWIFVEETGQLVAENLDYRNWTQGLERIMRHLRQNHALVLNVYHSVSHESVARYIQKGIRPYVSAIVRGQAQDMPIADEDCDFVIDLFTLGVSGLITEWFGAGMCRDDDHRLQKFSRALDGSLALMLHNFCRQEKDEKSASADGGGPL